MNQLKIQEADNLDAYTREILEFKKNLGQNIWLIGNRLLYIKEKQLYLEKYGLWSEYLEKELDFSDRSARSFMRLASNFNTTQIQQWGVRKLNLLLTLDEEERQKVMKVNKPEETVENLRRFMSDESEYFLTTERLLKDLLFVQLPEIKAHLIGCAFKKGFNTYQRKEHIENLLYQLQREVQKWKI